MPPKKPTKAQTRAHDAVSAAAREKGIQIRYARSIKSPGALCQVKDRLILFVKRSLDLDDQTAVMQAELDRYEKEGPAALSPPPPEIAETAPAAELAE
jgi:hypothetical protein